MSELLENESIDERARRAARQLRAASSARSLPDLDLRARRHWPAVLVATALIVGVVVGLVVIGTNRDDVTTGNGPARFQWLVTDLPVGWKAQRVLNPYSASDRRPPPPIENVYGTDALPADPVVSVAGSNGSPGADILPGEGGSNETNYRELSIDGRRAAFADGNSGQRIMYIETDGHWIRLTSRHIDDTVLTQLAQAAVYADDGTAMIPPPISAMVSNLSLLPVPPTARSGPLAPTARCRSTASEPTAYVS